jgi:hypothetical protein
MNFVFGYNSSGVMQRQWETTLVRACIIRAWILDYSSLHVMRFAMLEDCGLVRASVHR